MTNMRFLFPHTLRRLVTRRTSPPTRQTGSLENYKRVRRYSVKWGKKVIVKWHGLENKLFSYDTALCELITIVFFCGVDSEKRQLVQAPPTIRFSHISSSIKKPDALNGARLVFQLFSPFHLRKKRPPFFYEKTVRPFKIEFWDSDWEKLKNRQARTIRCCINRCMDFYALQLVAVFLKL